MRRTKATLDELRLQLSCAKVREFDNDFIVRMYARKDVKRLTAAIKRREKLGRTRPDDEYTVGTEARQDL